MKNYYETYMRSPEWRARRAGFIAAAGGRCQYCGSTELLQIHHLSYTNLGNEKPHDVAVLCRSCHANIGERARRLKPLVSSMTTMHAACCWAYRTCGPAWANTITSSKQLADLYDEFRLAKYRETQAQKGGDAIT